MDRINLLFINNVDFIIWEKHKTNWNQTINDLNVREFISFLNNINSDFPSQYLSRPCLNETDAIFRLDIMEEILSSSKLEEDLTSHSYKLKTLDRRIIELHNESNTFQKQYFYLRIVCEYFSIIQDMLLTLSGVKSLGLMTLYNFCNNVSINEKKFQLNAMALKLLIEIEDMLTNNILSNDPINKNFKFEKCNEDLNESQQLKSIIFKVFGITINNDYSIVDPAPFSNMEGKILNELKHSNEDIFNRLNKFYNDSIVILDEIESFSSIYEQLMFYTTYVKFLKSVVKGGIVICKPIFDENKFYAQDCASPSLITKCLENNTSLESIVTNDINLGKGKMFLLSGPNQGGKTIYLKSVGLNAYLAKCGCFVFSKSCFVPFYDVVATHFMRREVLGKGRLIEEVERMERLFLTISSNSLILLNESFTSTRRRDGVQISIYYINKLFEIGCTIGFVSHYYEIPEIYNKSEMIISLSCGIDSNRRRTYKVTKSPTKRLAYAQDIVYKCGMTFEQIRSEIEVAKNETD